MLLIVRDPFELVVPTTVPEELVVCTSYTVCELVPENVILKFVLPLGREISSMLPILRSGKAPPILKYRVRL